MKIPKKLKLYELECIETIYQPYKNKIEIPITYIPIGSDDGGYYAWRVFIGNRFVGEYSPWIRRISMSQLPYVKRPRLSSVYNKLNLSRRGIEKKKISRTLNVLEYRSSMYGTKRLIKSIKEHCGVDARIILQ